MERVFKTQSTMSGASVEVVGVVWTESKRRARFVGGGLNSDGRPGIVGVGGSIMYASEMRSSWRFGRILVKIRGGGGKDRKQC